MGPNNKSNRLIAVVLGGPSRHWRDRRVADLLEINFRKIGLGNSAPKVAELEDEGEDAEVNEFLKKELGRVDIEPKSSLRPIQINWTIPVKSKSHKAPDESTWGVQVGTYKSLHEARKRAQMMLRTLHAGEISLPRVSNGKKLSYGARLLKLTREEAESVCKMKSVTGNDCRILAVQ